MSQPTKATKLQKSTITNDDNKTKEAPSGPSNPTLTRTAAARTQETRAPSARSRSLREKVLAKTVVAKPTSVASSAIEATESLATPKKREDQEKALTTKQHEQPQHPHTSHPIDPEPSPTPNVLEKVLAWTQDDQTSQPTISEDDAVSVTSTPESESVCSEISHLRVRRQSLLFTTNRGTGVEMDLATKAANTLLLKGKEALESAGNMKRECKTTALDCLQSLYETVLSLSDSRSRHKLNLEKERSRHAQELVRIERAHNKQMAALTEDLIKTREQVAASLQESRDIRKWLEFETQEPHRIIKELSRDTKRVEKAINHTSDLVREKGKDKTAEQKADMEGKLNKITQDTTAIQNRLDELRQGLTKIESHTQELKEDLKTSNQQTTTALQQQQQQDPSKTTEETLKGLKSDMEKIASLLKTTNTAPQDPPKFEIGDQLQPITERLKMVSSELKTIREQRNEAPPQPAISIGTEMALAEMIKTQAGGTTTYAQAAAKKPPPQPIRRPNHTLIISSCDRNNTGDKIINILRQVLDPKKSGAKVDRVKKAKNQKVILSCNNKEDLALISNRLKSSKVLKAETARNNNPLVIIRDVMAYHTDAEIVEHILAQNKHVLDGVEAKERTIKVRYRKRARNNLECHPVLEVSPRIHKNMMETEKLYIDLQRRPVLDHSPLVQCTKCLGFGHTKALCQEKEGRCSHCGKPHTWEKCPQRIEGKPPTCINCQKVPLPPGQPHQTNINHNAFSSVCAERQKWDAIARAKISYLC